LAARASVSGFVNKFLSAGNGVDAGVYVRRYCFRQEHAAQQDKEKGKQMGKYSILLPWLLQSLVVTFCSSLLPVPILKMLVKLSWPSCFMGAAAALLFGVTTALDPTWDMLPSCAVGDLARLPVFPPATWRPAHT
jgi:hypothetical protein